MDTVFDVSEKLWINPNSDSSFNLDLRNTRWILNRLRLHGSKVAQINADNGHQMTFSEIRMEAIRIAQNLQNRGYKPREVFSFMAAHSDHLVPVFLASLCLACPVAPLHPMLTKAEIVRILTKTKPSVVFCDVNVYGKMNEALKELKKDVKVFTFGGKIDGAEPVENLLIETGDENNFQPVDHEIERDIALICCSSGTTGPSKCVCSSYRTFVLTPRIIEPSNILFCIDTLYWSVGILPMIDSMFNGATRVITAKSFTSELQLNLIEQYKISVLYISGYMMSLCLKNKMINKIDLSSIKAIKLYGNKWPATLGLSFRQYFSDTHSIIWYGLTETGACAISTLDTDGVCRGYQLLENQQAKIVDERGNRCGPGIAGEICFKSGHSFLGYLDDPIANASAVDNEGFFRTGDVGYFEKNGILIVEDRKKDVINVAYFDCVILPSEMEECLLGIPDIKEACIVGIRVETGDSLPAAVAVKQPHSKLTTRDIYHFIAENFPNRSRVRGGVYFVESLDKNNNGKLIRKKITAVATKMFIEAVKDNDPDIQSYLKDIPKEFRKINLNQ